MKKIMALFLTLTLMLTAAACANKTEDSAKPEETTAAQEAAETEGTVQEPEDGRKSAEEFNFTVKADEEQTVSDLIFSEDVTVEGDEGVIIFQNCRFEKNIYNRTAVSGIVRFFPGCEFASSTKAVISSGIKEATIETNLPKFMFLCEPVAVTIEDAGAIVAFAEYPVVLNGTSYAVEDSDMFLNEDGSEFGEYTGQESNMHNVSTWTEGGEAKIMQIAIYADME